MCIFLQSMRKEGEIAYSIITVSKSANVKSNNFGASRVMKETERNASVSYTFSCKMEHHLYILSVTLRRQKTHLYQ